MTLGDIRTRVCRVIGMSHGDSADLALIDSWVNEAVVQFLKDTKVNVITASLLATADVGDYTLDEDILSFTDVWYEPADGTGQVLLEQIDSLDLQRRRIFDTTSATPRYYAQQGAHLLMLYPTPASDSDLLHILYTPRPGLIASAEQEPSDIGRGNIPPEYHPVIEAYVKWKAGEAEEHKPSEYGLSFQAEYERGVKKAISSMNLKSGVFRARKTLARRGHYPVSPGVDSGR